MRKMLFLIVLGLVLVGAGCGSLGSSDKDKDYLHDSEALALRVEALEKKVGGTLRVLDLSVVNDRGREREINIISLYFVDPKNPGKSGRILYDAQNTNVPVLPGEMSFGVEDGFILSEFDLRIVPKFVEQAEEAAKQQGWSYFKDEELRVRRDSESGEIRLRLVIKSEQESGKSLLVDGDATGKVVGIR
jgi:hypothetical protein